MIDEACARHNKSFIDCKSMIGAIDVGCYYQLVPLNGPYSNEM